MLADEDLMNDYGMTRDEVEKLKANADRYAQGEWPEGKITRIGRPRMLVGEPVSIAFRDTLETRTALDERASRLGISRSDYLRQIVRKELETA